jgi:hypothetical protein
MQPPSLIVARKSARQMYIMRGDAFICITELNSTANGCRGIE